MRVSQDNVGVFNHVIHAQLDSGLTGFLSHIHVPSVQLLHGTCVYMWDFSFASCLLINSHGVHSTAKLLVQ